MLLSKAAEEATTAVAQDVMSEAARELHELSKTTADGYTHADSGPEDEAASPIDISVSRDGMWQKRGHQSLYGIQAAISADTEKVLDCEVRNKYCHECYTHQTWDRQTTKYKDWKNAHEPDCKINYTKSSNSMEAHGAKIMWCRSLDKHNLRYATYIGDGDSASDKLVVGANPYDDTVIKRSVCIGHIQKAMGTTL
jgi:hypothetical protein